MYLLFNLNQEKGYTKCPKCLYTNSTIVCFAFSKYLTALVQVQQIPAIPLYYSDFNDSIKLKNCKYLQLDELEM